ncbi:MAG: Flp pilus assembly protein CpaB [Candidatus Omnitrophica bacterium]|nr:Flp pilus assembly protein CpaB [Candidatus Omnitrophota bacterium]
MNVENKKQLVIILFAVGLGLVAAVATGQYIQNTITDETKRMTKEIEDKKVKPLAQEIAAMRDQIKVLASRPVAAGPGGGESGGGALPKSTLSLMTPAGKRAYTVRIDPLSAVGGMINPGDFVDILAHMNMPDPVSQKTERITSIVFQNVKVLAVGTNLQATGGYEQQQAAGALNITFALSPEESGLMSFMEKNGQLQMVLRAPSETTIEELRKADWQNLAEYVFDKQKTEIATPIAQSKLRPETEKKEEAKPYIEIFKGGQQQ